MIQLKAEEIIAQLGVSKQSFESWKKGTTTNPQVDSSKLDQFLLSLLNRPRSLA